MQLSAGSSGLEPIDASGFGAKLPRNPTTCDLPSASDAATHPRRWRNFHRTFYAGNETPRTQDQNSGGACLVCRRARGRERLDHAQAGADVRHPQAALRARDRYRRRRRGRGAAGRLRLPALARGQLPARPGRHLRLALANPPLRPAHRRHHRRPHPQPEGRRALFRAAQGQLAQFRGPRESAPQGQFRQPDAALSGRVAEDGISRIRPRRISRPASSTSWRRSARASAR